jgi:hypothetical protein
VTLILFTTRAPHPLADQLINQGHRTLEALAPSEVFALMRQHREAQIIITADVPCESAQLVQQHYPTVQLHESTTIQQILWELSQIEGTVQ